MVDTRVTLSGWTLDNPVVAASGCFGYGREFAEWYDIGCLGTFSCKGTTLAPRVGNPTPRIAETPSGMLNAIGLQNPGVERVIAEELPALAAVFDKKIIANVGGFSTDEMAECARRLSEQPQVGLIELNVSCPNLHAGGVNFANDPKAAAAATAAVKKVSRKPVYVKLSPNVTDLTEIAKACADAGADGLCLINTLLGMRIDPKTRRPLLANGTGGLSGPAVFPIALRAVYQVYEAVKLPLIGCGGVNSAAGVIEMMLAGATVVEIGAANLTDPLICKKIISDLPAEAERCQISSLCAIIGGAHA